MMFDVIWVQLCHIFVLFEIEAKGFVSYWIVGPNLYLIQVDLQPRALELYYYIEL